MAILQYMVENAGKVISRETLFDRFWHNQVVTNDALNRALSNIRKTLGDNANNPQYIATLRNQGYKLVAPVTLLPDPTVEQHHASLNNHQETEPKFSLKLSWLAASLILALTMLLTVIAFWPQVTSNSFESDKAGPLKWQRLTYDNQQNTMATLSPDGQTMAFIARTALGVGQLIVQPDTYKGFSLGEATAHYSYPQFSLDGKNVLVFSEKQGIHRLSSFNITEQNEHIIQELETPSQGLHRHPHQDLLVYTQPHPDSKKSAIVTRHMRLDNMTPLTDGGNGLYDSQPKFSPSGQTIAFIRTFAYREAAIFITDLQGNIQQISNNFNHIYSYVWLTNETLLLGLNEGFVKLNIDGKQQAMASGQLESTISSMHYHQADKRLLVGYQNQSAHLASLSIQMGRQPHQLTESQTKDLEGAVSNSRQMLAFISIRSGQSMLWLRSGNQTSAIAGTASASLYDLQWSPNDRHIAVISKRSNEYALLLVDPSARSEVFHSLGNEAVNLIGWLDDKHLLYTTKQPDGWQLFQFNLNNKSASAVGQKKVYQGRLTPDKRRLVYVDDDHKQLWLWDFSSSPKNLIGTPHGTIDRNWFVDNDNLYYLLASNDIGKDQLWRLALYGKAHDKVAVLPKMTTNARPDKAIYRLINSRLNQPLGDIWSTTLPSPMN